mgnify:CR=1 FL=1
MAGIFGTLYVANSGMRAMQESINTSANNIANSQTEGYSRKRVNLVTNAPQYYMGIGEISTGVRIDSVTRIRDEFLDRQVRAERGRFATYEAKNEILGKVETIFREPSETGLNKAMSEMWDAWQELSKTPENSTARTIVTEQARTFTDMLNHMATQLQETREEVHSGIAKSTLDVNTLVEQIRTLDNQIINLTTDGILPNDLLDSRDLMLDKLSDLTNFKVVPQADGGISLTIGGEEMVKEKVQTMMSAVKSVSGPDGSGNFLVTLVPGGDERQESVSVTMTAAELADLKAGDVVFHQPGDLEGTPDPDNFEKFVPTNGRLAGQQMLLTELDGYEAELDNLARSVAGLVNTVHRTSVVPGDPILGTSDVSSDVGGLDFFVSSDAGAITASSIRVNQELLDDVSKINVGKYTGGADGDGSRALAIAQLRNVRMNVGDGTTGAYDGLSMTFANLDTGDTTDNYFKNSVARLGVSAQQAIRMMDNQEALLNQMNERRESISGVSIDEEVSDLIKFQNGYAANARVMSTLVMMLDTLINIAR